MPNLYTCVWLNMYSTRRLFHNVSLSLVPSFIFVSPLFLLLPACFRSETRIILMKLKFKTCRIHSTWNTFNPNLPRRISSPTFDADVVVIRCQSALLCRNSILIHLYFFLQKAQDPYWKKGLNSLKKKKYTSGAVLRMVQILFSLHVQFM